MKRIYKILGILFFITILGCTKEEIFVEEQHSLVGKWEFKTVYSRTWYMGSLATDVLIQYKPDQAKVAFFENGIGEAYTYDSLDVKFDWYVDDDDYDKELILVINNAYSILYKPYNVSNDTLYMLYQTGDGYWTVKQDFTCFKIE